ncbi:MAG: cell division protein FtsZ, partial [Chitinophagaceae bacterium]
MIKVIGIGGGGCNTVNYMHDSFTTQGIDFILCNTDNQVLESSTIHHKIQLGTNTTEGLGAGGDIEVGEKATEESIDQIRTILDPKTKMVFIATTLGGGTGSGGAPVVAKICKEMGILTVAIVTRPLSKGSKLQIINAEKAIELLREYADTLLIISNDKLIKHYGTQKMSEAFKKADDVLANSVQSIVSLITTKGYINVDFADVRKVMINGETGMFGMAKANGENRALRAIEEAISCPLLDYEDIAGARWALVNIATPIGEHEVTFEDIQSIQDFIIQKTGEETEIKIGITYDEILEDY